jgi:hypothetical protein
MIGFVVDTSWDGGTPGVADNAKIWVKPLDMLKITTGFFKEDDFRGTVSTTEFSSWLLPSGGFDKDNIFTRFSATLGAHFSVTPIEGLIIQAAIGSNIIGPGGSLAPRNIDGLSLADVYKGIQVAAGYKIPDVGFVRAQFIGNNRKVLKPNLQNNATNAGQIVMEGLSTNGDADVIEAAFQFNMIENLNVDLGAKIPLKYLTDTAFEIYHAVNPYPPVLTSDGEERIVQKPYVVAVGINWAPGFLYGANLLFRLDTSLGGSVLAEDMYKLELGMVLNAWLIPSYKILDNLAVGLDIGMEYHEKDKWQQPIGRLQESRTEGSEYFDIGLGPWVELDMGSGTLKTGIMVMLPGSERDVYVADNSVGYRYQTLFSGDPVISFPLCFTYNF